MSILRLLEQKKVPCSSWLAGILLVAFWLLYLKPYYGIRHDSVLYLGQALLLRAPEQLAQDLFFAYGSQSQYTFFPELIAWLLGYFRPSEIFLTLTLFSLCAFAASSFSLIRTLFVGREQFYALLAVLILPTGYGSHLIFSYAEPFFSGRSIAEPLLLATIAAWLAGHRKLAALCWLLAATIHPLQALVIPMLGFSTLIWMDKRWWHLLWLILPVLGLAWIGVKPFNQLVIPYDSEWYGWVIERTPHVFLSAWKYQAWGYWLTDIFLGWLLVQYSTGRLQLLARSAIMATIFGMLATLVLADILGLVLPTGLQLWRAQWFLHWLVMASAAWLLIADWRINQGPTPRWALLVAVIVYGSPIRAIVPSSLAVLCLIPLYLAWPYFEKKVATWLMQILRVFAWLILVLGLAKYSQGVWAIYMQMDGEREAVRPEFMLVTYPLVAGLLVCAGIFFWSYAKRWRIFFLAILMLALIHAVDVWDRRNKWTRYIEAAQYSPQIFGVDFPTAAQVFWDDEVLAPWLILQRPQFTSSQQSAGIAFNRGTAVEAVRREKLFALFEMQKQICKVFNNLNEVSTATNIESCVIDNKEVAKICASVGPDYFILTEPLKMKERGTWSIVGGPKGSEKITYYLYSCTDFSHLVAENE